MKRIFACLTALALLALCIPASLAAGEPDRVPQPVYYQNFEDSRANRFMGSDVLIKNNSPKNLSTKISEKDGNHSFFFSTRNKNNESQTLFRLYELEETVTDFSAFMRVSFDSSRDNWSTKGTSRVGLAYAIKDGANYSYASLRYKSTASAALNRQVGEEGASVTNRVPEGSTDNGYTMDVAIDTVYEMAVVVKDGKLSFYINGKLIRTDADGNASAIDYIADGRGIGFYGAYTSVNIDEFRVYDCAYVPQDYDALGATPYTGDAAKAPLPALPKIEEKDPAEDTDPAPAAGTVLWEQDFDNVTVEALEAEFLKKTDDAEITVSDGRLYLNAAAGSSSQVVMKFGAVPENVGCFTIVMKVRFETLIDYLDDPTGSEKSLIGPAYAIAAGDTYSSLSLRANGTYNFTRYLAGKWVSNKTNPEGGSSRNGKYYSVAQGTDYEIAMVITAEGRVRSYINGILQPDDIPYLTDGYGFGIFFRNGSFSVDSYRVVSGEYVPAGYGDVRGEPSMNDDLYIEEPDDPVGPGDPTDTEDPGSDTKKPGTEENKPDSKPATDPSGTSAPEAPQTGGCASSLTALGILPVLLAGAFVLGRGRRRE